MKMQEVKEMTSKSYCMTSGAIFSMVALAHFLRIVNGSSILIDGYTVPMLVSWIAMIVPATLAAWAFRTSRG